VENVSHSYGGHVALRDVTARFPPGVTAVVGPNGAGKTTLMRIVAGGLKPGEGRVVFSGSHGRQIVGLMPQACPLPRRVRVADFLHYIGWAQGVPRGSRSARVSDALARTGLADTTPRTRIGELSGGMQRRLLLAQALLVDAPVLVLDEPTVGLDPEHRLRIRTLVSDLGRDRAVIVTTHLMDDVAQVADRVVALSQGSVVYDGGIEELRRLGRGLEDRFPGASPEELGYLAVQARVGAA
jgi:ABC-2 type transport system ATP-binding protein